MGGMEDTAQQQQYAVGQAQTAADTATAAAAISTKVSTTARARPLALDLNFTRFEEEGEEEMSSEAQRALRTAEFGNVEGLVGRLSGLMREVKEMSGEARVEAKMAEVEDRIEEMRELVLYVAAAWLSPEVRKGRKNPRNLFHYSGENPQKFLGLMKAFKCFIGKATQGRDSRLTYRTGLPPKIEEIL
jgi:hypothetical protein